MDSLGTLIAFLIVFTVSVSASTEVNTNSVETPNITSTESQLSIGSVTNFTSNPVKGVNNLFFSSTAYIVQNSNGDDMIFQLYDDSGTRNNFLRFDNSVLSANFSTPLDMGSNRISNLANPTEAQDAATMSWVNDNDAFEADTNASTECSSDQVLTGSGCASHYTSSDDGDSSDTNEIQDPSVTANGNEITVDLNNGGGSDSATVGTSGSCPSGYVRVPGSNKHGTEDFCVMKYEAKNDGSGNPVSQASGSPWTSITQYDARQECRSLGKGYHLITESEWMTIADNVMRQENNWADGTVGSKASNGGGLYLGNVDPSGDHSHLGYNGDDPESGTGRDTTARFQLSNGNYIWDFSGNVWEWTNGYVTNDGVPEPDGNGWTEYTDITKFQAMEDEKPLNPSWNASNGIGKIYLDQSNIHAVKRSGGWNQGVTAGALTVNLYSAPSLTSSSTGFRCVADL